VLRLGDASLELAPSIRVGLPITGDGAPARLEPAVAVGGAISRFSWLANLGGRFRLAADDGPFPAATAQGFVLAGATADVVSWLRVSALVDAHLAFREAGTKDVLVGLGAGVEAGTSIFGALSFRASPLPDPGVGPFAAQLSLGVRQVKP
jgi:hypothetical protein